MKRILLISGIVLLLWGMGTVSAFSQQQADFSIKMQKAVESRRIEAAAKSGEFRGGGVDADSVHSWDALHYQIEMSFNTSQQTISAVTTITGEAVESSLDSVDLHLAQGYTVTQVLANGISVGWRWTGQDFIVALDRIHNAGETFEITVSYQGAPPLITNPNALYGMGIRWGNTIFTYTDRKAPAPGSPVLTNPTTKQPITRSIPCPRIMLWLPMAGWIPPW